MTPPEFDDYDLLVYILFMLVAAIISITGVGLDEVSNEAEAGITFALVFSVLLAAYRLGKR